MARAVRNRRELLTAAIARVYDQWNEQVPMPVTCLASGAAREVFDVFSVRDRPRIRITCIDIDPEVNAYAAKIASEAGAVENTVFLQQNLLKVFAGRGKAELAAQQMIYAVGLIDYLRDRQVVMLLNWAYDHLKPGGRIMIGQFHPSSPDRAFLDHIADWALFYRDHEQIEQLFAASKFGDAPVTLTTEDAGVQTFASCDKVQPRP
jgi:SAM-dependent methyltransferase